jgi:hypothetical protein
MDLIRMMNENRAKMNIVKETKKEVFSPAPLAMDKRPKTFQQRRKDIITEVPKIKVVREYFADLVKRLSGYSSDEEEI